MRNIIMAIGLCFIAACSSTCGTKVSVVSDADTLDASVGDSECADAHTLTATVVLPDDK